MEAVWRIAQVEGALEFMAAACGAGALKKDFLDLQLVRLVPNLGGISVVADATLHPGVVVARCFPDMELSFRSAVTAGTDDLLVAMVEPADRPGRNGA